MRAPTIKVSPGFGRRPHNKRASLASRHHLFGLSARHAPKPRIVAHRHSSVSPMVFFFFFMFQFHKIQSSCSAAVSNANELPRNSGCSASGKSLRAASYESLAQSAELIAKSSKCFRSTGTSTKPNLQWAQRAAVSGAKRRRARQRASGTSATEMSRCPPSRQKRGSCRRTRVRRRARRRTRARAARRWPPPAPRCAAR